MLEVRVFDGEGRVVAQFLESDDTAVDFVSLVSNETYGPPALVAPARGLNTRAEVGDRVLYINTALVPMFQIERL